MSIAIWSSKWEDCSSSCNSSLDSQFLSTNRARCSKWTSSSDSVLASSSPKNTFSRRDICDCYKACDFLNWFFAAFSMFFIASFSQGGRCFGAMVGLAIVQPSWVLCPMGTSFTLITVTCSGAINLVQCCSLGVIHTLLLRMGALFHCPIYCRNIGEFRDHLCSH